jgi:uncharacterized protein YdhG (YjbR/CyaY superfamily)
MKTASTKPTTIDECLATLSDERRAVLEKLRQTIRSAAPKAEECVSYQLPAFRHNGGLVCFGAAENHYALYPMSARTVAAFADELKGYSTSKGTIRFPWDKPVPVALIKKIVKARIAENEAKRGKRPV